METYTIRFEELLWDVSVEIDRNNEKLEEAIKEMVDFWTGSERRLAENGGNYLITFLKQLGQECFSVMAGHNYTVEGLQDHFVQLEGWTPMRGECGIEIIAVDDLDLSTDQFSVSTDGVELT